jgi:hypothetical protein
MRPGQIIVLATPVFFLLIAIEFAVGRVRARRGTGQDTYRLADAVNSIGLGMLSQISAVLTGLLRIGIYTAVYSALALFPQEAATSSGPPGTAGCWRWCSTTSATTGCTAWATSRPCCGPRTWCTTRASTTTCRRRCARRRAARCSAGSSTCRWRWPACRRWCSAWWRWSTCSTSSGCTPSRWASSAGSTAGSARRRTTACTTR